MSYLKVAISNFKSIGDITFDLQPLTILIGPPASGKSNILDALGLLGYFNRFLLLDKEYNNQAINLEPLSVIARFDNQLQLFRNHDPANSVSLSVADNNIKLNLGLTWRPNFAIFINEKQIPWDLLTLPPAGDQSASNLRKILSEIGKFIESRLYGFDRYGLGIGQCASDQYCGFHIRLRGVRTKPTPNNILSELGWNVINFTKGRGIVQRINNALREHLDERIELKVLRSGALVLFDYDIEIEVRSVSDSVFRLIYYILALSTASSYVKIYGLENSFIVLLEEPEAHIFPFMFDLLRNEIIHALKAGVTVVIATHNPIFVSALWDKIKELETYYVYRDSNLGSTRLVGLDIEKMAENLVNVEDILNMNWKEVVEKYSKASEKRKVS